jgi:hypothetical protein
VGGVITLDVAIDRLLHKPAVLAEFLGRGPAALGLDAADADALDQIDRGQLVRTAAHIRGQILHRQQRGSGSLLNRFPRTIAAFAGADLDGLAGEFLGSAQFDDYREVPFAGLGRSLEECFFRFAEARGLGEAAVREQEFLSAILRALVVNPDPDFSVPAEVRRAPGGYFAVSVRSGPTLFAALGGRFVTGALTPFLAALLVSPETPDEVARRHAVTGPVLAASLVQLVELGLRARE